MYSVTAEQLKAAAISNPSLLNSPQVQQYLNNPSMQQPQIQQPEYPSAQFQNDIDINNSKTQKTQVLSNRQQLTYSQEQNESIERLNPLEYKNNNQKLWEIKSDQSKIEQQKLERFSSIFFRNKNHINTNRIVVPSDYIINKGDTITFWIYGATNIQHALEVDQRGNINIPQVGPVHVAGEKFTEVKSLLTNYLSSLYKNSQVVVDLNSFSTAQVTITGFVKTPGIYNTTTISSVKDLLIEAGGVSDVGSVRKIQILRNGKVIDTIDYYHLLLLGRDHGDTVLQSGDVIHVPRAYGLITIDGEVNTPAIYEIERGETLAHILRFAGGLKAVASGKRIFVKRYSRNSNINYHTLTLSQARRFITHDGDEIYIGKLHKTDERYVEILGNVIDPGKKYIGSKKMQLSNFLHRQLKGNRLDRFFLENTDFNYAMIKRLDSNLQEKIFHVNLKKVLEGKENFLLQNKDKIYIFNLLDTQINPYVTIIDATTRETLNKNKKLLERIKVSKKIDLELQDQQDFNTSNILNQDINISDENITDVYINKINRVIIDHNLTKSALLLKPGKYSYTQGMTLEDLIHVAGIKKPFDTSKVKIVSRYADNGKVRVKIINYTQNKNYKLKPFDTIHLFDLEETKPVPMADIIGEVVKPGSYEVVDGMTLHDFITSAGGLTEKAYPKQCEVIRYYLKNGERKKKIFNVPLDQMKTFLVNQFDEINIKKVPYWDDKKVVTLSGQVKFPGEYIIHSGEKLSSVIKRAGGFTNDAFLYGAIFTRKEIALMQKKSLQRSLSKLKEQIILASLRSSGSKSMGQINVTDGIKAVESLISEAEKITPIGRVSINLTKDLKKFENSPSNLTLKDGDTLQIPSFNEIVVISGEVMNPMALTYLGKDVQDYITQCGGLTEVADSDHIYVLHANGQAQKASLGSYLFSSNNIQVRTGDTIIIPKKIMFERGIDIAGDIADIIYKLTLTVAAMNTVGVL